ncbi:hypothetical protein VTN77DRAFT_683 [Rasamsonia byssochlamydoides]|uniref:uncharacterized protein n=1 Tax=Rasamsonia byssochlamydoides TaxID=89139 RepID=UPI003743E451
MAFYDRLPPGTTGKPTRFRVAVPEQQLAEFQQLLRLSKIAPATYENQQKDRRYGISRDWLVEAKAQWEQFDWRRCEEHINSFPQFKIPIKDVDNIELEMHFMGLFSHRTDAVPLIFLHGWPGSFLEFLPILTLFKNEYDPDDLPYHIVVPSLPGYAFSSAPPLHKDFQIQDVARVMNTLMVALGFGNGYVAQGGDIGSKVARIMAAEHAACKAVHINYCLMSEPKGVDVSQINNLEHEGVIRLSEFRRLGSAYALEQATRPSTIGLVLSASPLALLAWIGEKFLDWTDNDPPMSLILEAVTLYWLTDTLPRAIYPHRQLFTPGAIPVHETPQWHIKKPLGYSWFPKEVAPIPRAWAATTGNLVFHRQHTQGGHFAALEQPETLKKDVTDFIAQVWPG